jgi:hypothetical protein
MVEGELGASSLEKVLWVRSALGGVDRNKDLSPGPDSQPGNRVVDLFQSRFHRHGPTSKKDEDIAKYKNQLDLAWAEAYIDESCCMVAADASVPTGGVFQAAAAALVYRQGEVVGCVVSVVGRHAPPEVERFALQLGISAALAKGCQKLVVISDSLPAVESLFSVELWSFFFFFFFFFFFLSTIYNAGLACSPRACSTNSTYSTTTLRIAHYYIPGP